MKKYDGYLIVTDLDNTLLNDESEISGENMAAISEFTENGGKFTIATGRTPQAASAYYNKLPVNLPAVLDNGALLYDFEKGCAIAEKFIEEEHKEAIYKFCEEHPETGVEVYTSDGGVYVFRTCSLTERLLRRDEEISSNKEEARSKNWMKALLIDELENTAETERIFKSCYDGVGIQRSGDRFLDIVSDKASKGNAVIELADMYNIERSRIIAAGDNINDVNMIKTAHYGVAVLNACEEAKAAADFIAPDHNESVISFILKNVIR